MTSPTQPLAVTNPEAARHLALSTYYLRRSDFARAIQYARLPILAGEPSAIINLLTTQVLARKYEAAAETATMCLSAQVHHTVRKGVLEAVLPALYFLGAQDGDCSQAYALAAELAAHANLNPEHPRWQGQPLKGKTLLVSLSEACIGGWGDHIMWARFIPYVAATGARIVVQGPSALARLFMTIPGVVSVCDFEQRPTCDYALSIMELPHALGLTGVPVGNPFNVGVVPFPEETHAVAINWGASWAAPYMDRACALAEYLPLMQLPATTLYAVQKGAHQRQLYPPPVGFQAQDLAPNLADFLDTAVVLSSMDAVVTTDNVVGNLACMLGRPTFVLVAKCADWRWGSGGHTPWYPTARVYQQEVAGEWEKPIAALTQDLHAYLQTHARKLPQAEPTEQPKTAETVTPEAA
ncbi:MAG: hypothetical protein KDH09_02485 [Chrysiogenetes bacterium]|nr:hypothetical protein [Chrysiogenetes bacterium]